MYILQFILFLSFIYYIACGINLKLCFSFISISWQNVKLLIVTVSVRNEITTRLAFWNAKDHVIPKDLEYKHQNSGHDITGTSNGT